MTRRSFLASAALTAQVPPNLSDFSNAGYAGGGVDIPNPPTRLSLKPQPGDATARIQDALDQLAALPESSRGALLLEKGEYAIAGTLRISASRIVLRGESGTTLLATGTSPRSLIELAGRPQPAEHPPAATITSELVPVGARTFSITTPHALRPGQQILVRRFGNAAWIREIGMDRIRPRPADPANTRQWTPFSLDFERTITAIDGPIVTIDAPIFCAIEQRWGGGAVIPRSDSGRISECAVENLRAVSAYDKSVTALYGREKEKYHSDEAHARSLLTIDHAFNCWARHLTALCFSFACVDLRHTRHVTVQDSHCGEMVSLITGSRRYPFNVSGQLSLVQRCSADTARHDFAVGARVAGPNVFLDCRAGRSFATSEPHHRWSVGGLYDNAKANIAFQDRQYMGTGHGWSGANYVAWNCEGSLVCQKPPTADNWAIGHVGPKEPGAFAPRPDGTWISHGRHVQPRSLYLHQLAARKPR